MTDTIDRTDPPAPEGYLAQQVRETREAAAAQASDEALVGVPNDRDYTTGLVDAEGEAIPSGYLDHQVADAKAENEAARAELAENPNGTPTDDGTAPKVPTTLREDYEALKNDDLQVLLNAADLPVSGNKEELVERLLVHDLGGVRGQALDENDLLVTDDDGAPVDVDGYVIEPPE